MLLLEYKARGVVFAILVDYRYDVVEFLISAASKGDLRVVDWAET